MSILEYSLSDLLFAFWLDRQRDYLAKNKPVPPWLKARLDQLRPVRNPNASIFILRGGAS